jgi:aldehyde:ferredoxin oxidoreductase
MIVNLRTAEITQRPLNDPLVGGRLLSDQLVSELVNPRCDPLSAENALTFCCGPLAGLRVSTGGRLSVGAKSPLTRGIKEANAGGMAGDSMAALGYRALVFTNRAPTPTIFILDENGYRFADASRYRGMDNEELREAINHDFGRDYCNISIGVPGERMMRAAGVVVSDARDQPFRVAARGGLGAVMGSKNLKAILLRKSDVTAPASIKDAMVRFHRAVASNDRVQVLREYGTASMTMTMHALGGLPVRNFSRGALDDPEAINGDALRDLTLARGGVGTPTEECMRGCVIRCSNVFPTPDGKLAAAPVEFETIALCGINLGLNDFDAIARINRLCNDLGLDTIEVGAALGVMMQADDPTLPRFGDAQRAAEIVAEIRAGGRLGNLIGNGVVATAKALGVQRVPAVKGQAMSAYDPRAVKGTGVTYATSPQGADHTAGLTVFAQVDHRDPTIAVAMSRASQIQRAAFDALGLCTFNLGATHGQIHIVLDMLRQHYGVALENNWLNQWGRAVIDLELAFNRAAGLTLADDRLPEFFRREPLEPTRSVFDVSTAEMDRLWEVD